MVPPWHTSHTLRRAERHFVYPWTCLRASSDSYSHFTPLRASRIVMIDFGVPFDNSSTTPFGLSAVSLNPTVRKCFRFLENSAHTVITTATPKRLPAF